MKLNTAKRIFKNQWIAFKYSDRDKTEGEVLCRGKDRRALYKKLRGKKIDGAYLTYTGPLVSKKFAIMFAAKFTT